MNTDYSQAIAAAGAALKDSPLGQMPHILAAWHAVKWNEGNSSGDAQVSYSDPESISLSNGLLQKDEQEQTAALLREFGIGLMQGQGKFKNVWEDKLCLPDSEQIDAVQRKLQSEEFDTYRELVESFKTALDRLVALNCCNALLANSVPRAQSRNVNILQWGSTADYANLRRYHSIKPLIYAYTEREIAECPGRALAELIIHNLGHVRESTVSKAFHGVIVETYRACR